MSRVLIADDHPLVRAALQAAVRRTRPDVACLHAESLTVARRILEREPDIALVLLDLRMADCDGFVGLLTLRAEHPATPVVVVSASEDARTVERALSFGAAGFIPKSASLATMTRALEAVLAGEVWNSAAELPPPDDRRLGSLTPAQLRILVELSKGRLNKQIAYDMGVSEATVKAHVTAIFRKLGVQNRTQAVILAGALSTEPESR